MRTIKMTIPKHPVQWGNTAWLNKGLNKENKAKLCMKTGNWLTSKTLNIDELKKHILTGQPLFVGYNPDTTVKEYARKAADCNTVEVVILDVDEKFNWMDLDINPDLVTCVYPSCNNEVDKDIHKGRIIVCIPPSNKTTLKKRVRQLADALGLAEVDPASCTLSQQMTSPNMWQQINNPCRFWFNKDIPDPQAVVDYLDKHHPIIEPKPPVRIPSNITANMCINDGNRYNLDKLFNAIPAKSEDDGTHLIYAQLISAVKNIWSDSDAEMLASYIIPGRSIKGYNNMTQSCPEAALTSALKDLGVDFRSCYNEREKPVIKNNMLPKPKPMKVDNYYLGKEELDRLVSSDKRINYITAFPGRGKTTLLNSYFKTLDKDVRIVYVSHRIVLNEQRVNADDDHKFHFYADFNGGIMRDNFSTTINSIGKFQLDPTLKWIVVIDEYTQLLDVFADTFLSIGSKATPLSYAMATLNGKHIMKYLMLDYNPGALYKSYLRAILDVSEGDELEVCLTDKKPPIELVMDDTFVNKNILISTLVKKIKSEYNAGKSVAVYIPSKADVNIVSGILSNEEYDHTFITGGSSEEEKELITERTRQLMKDATKTRILLYNTAMSTGVDVNKHKFDLTIICNYYSGFYNTHYDLIQAFMRTRPIKGQVKRVMLLEVDSELADVDGGKGGLFNRTVCNMRYDIMRHPMTKEMKMGIVNNILSSKSALLGEYEDVLKRERRIMASNALLLLSDMFPTEVVELEKDDTYVEDIKAIRKGTIKSKHYMIKLLLEGNWDLKANYSEEDEETTISVVDQDGVEYTSVVQNYILSFCEKYAGHACIYTKREFLPLEVDSIKDFLKQVRDVHIQMGGSMDKVSNTLIVGALAQRFGWLPSELAPSFANNTELKKTINSAAVAYRLADYINNKGVMDSPVIRRILGYPAKSASAKKIVTEVAMMLKKHLYERVVIINGVEYRGKKIKGAIDNNKKRGQHEVINKYEPLITNIHREVQVDVSGLIAQLMR